MASLEVIAKAERTDVPQLFVRASRLYATRFANPSSDYQKWKESGQTPSYLSEYIRYWERLNRTPLLGEPK